VVSSVIRPRPHPTTDTRRLPSSARGRREPIPLRPQVISRNPVSARPLFFFFSFRKCLRTPSPFKVENPPWRGEGWGEGEISKSGGPGPLDLGESMIYA